VPGSPGRVLVIATREDLTIVREIQRLIGGHDTGTVTNREAVSFNAGYLNKRLFDWA